ncbi:hypothetical protein MP638_003856 [Amoeboaphelidium occidentale]|nr:hypothetical protein MP638_003856 [Amoeboaphelidium occidentale]
MSQRLAIQYTGTRSSPSAVTQFKASKGTISWCTANYYAPLAQLNNKITVHKNPPEAYHLNRQSPESKKRKKTKPLQSGMSFNEKQICSRMKSGPAADETMRSVKIRVHPDAIQKAALKQIFGIVRVVWNQGLDEMFVRGHPKNWQSLRNKIVTTSNVPEEDRASRPWLYDGNICSSKIKEETIHKLVSSIKATEESFREQNKAFKYKMSRKKKKDNEMNKQGSKEYKRLVEVVWEKPDHFYVCFPYNKTNQEKTKENHPKAAALDPGLRTFQTVYDSFGNFFEAGKGDIRRVERLCLNLDRLISKAAEVKTGRKNRYKRRRMNAAIQRARQRIKNLISNFHGKLAHDLTSRYNVILIPTFDQDGNQDKSQDQFENCKKYA